MHPAVAVGPSNYSGVAEPLSPDRKEFKHQASIWIGDASAAPPASTLL